MTSPEAKMNSNSRPVPDLNAMLRGRDSYLEHRGTEGGGGHLSPDPYAPDATGPSSAPQVRQVLGPDL